MIIQMFLDIVRNASRVSFIKMDCADRGSRDNHTQYCTYLNADETEEEKQDGLLC